MSVTILSGNSLFAQAVDNATPAETPLEATVNPVNRYWNTVVLPYKEYLNERVSEAVYLYPQITNPGLLSRYVKGGEAGCGPDGRRPCSPQWAV